MTDNTRHKDLINKTINKTINNLTHREIILLLTMIMFMIKITVTFYANEVECNSNGKHNKR